MTRKAFWRFWHTVTLALHINSCNHFGDYLRESRFSTRRVRKNTSKTVDAEGKQAKKFTHPRTDRLICILYCRVYNCFELIIVFDVRSRHELFRMSVPRLAADGDGAPRFATTFRRSFVLAFRRVQ